MTEGFLQNHIKSTSQSLRVAYGNPPPFTREAEYAAVPTVQYIFQSVRSTHFFSLFTFHSSLPVRTFATALLCLIFAYASYFSACRVNILAYRTHTCQQKNTEMTKNISVISVIFLLNFKPLPLCLCAAEEPLKFSAFSRPQCRI